MPGRSPHRHSPPPPPMISRRSPVLRGRMRSPDRRRPIAGSPRSRRPADFRTGSVRRSRSPVEKVRSLSPPVKRNLSSKRIRENTRRPSSPHARKLSRSKSPVDSRLLGYKAGPSTSSSTERFHTGSYEKERVQFRGPEGSIIDSKELKFIKVEIRRPQLPVDGSTLINRSITNPEDIVPVHRPGMRSRDLPSNFPDKPDWAQDGGFRRHKSFQSEGSRPTGIRPEFVAESSRVRQSDEYRKIVAIDSVQSSERDRSERDKERRYSPARYEEPPQPFYSREARERPRSPGYSSSRRTPTRSEFYEGREKIHDDRRDSNRDDLRHELDLRRRDDGHYPERHSSYDRERESDLRTRIIEKRSEPHHRHEDHYERERRRDHLSPAPRERRRGSADIIRPSRGDAWEREPEHDGGERRKRPLSRDRERDDGRIRGNGRERYDEFDDAPDRLRPFKPDHRGYFKEEGDFIPSAPIRGRGGPPIRRGYSGPGFRGRFMSRGAPRGFRGSPFIRGGPPRGSFMGSRGGFIPRK